MSLDKIQLPLQIIPELYNNSIVVLDGEQPKSKTLKVDTFQFLGGNKKNILILVENRNEMYLTDDDLQFLTGILNACGLSMADVAIVNTYNLQHKILDLKNKFYPIILMAFGINWNVLGIENTLPLYQSTIISEINVINAQPLHLLAKNVEEKKILWNCLKQIFIKK